MRNFMTLIAATSVALSSAMAAYAQTKIPFPRPAMCLSDMGTTSRAGPSMQIKPAEIA